MLLVSRVPREDPSPRSRLGRARRAVGMTIDPNAKRGSIDKGTEKAVGEQARPDNDVRHPTDLRAARGLIRSGPTFLQQQIRATLANRRCNTTGRVYENRGGGHRDI